MTLLFPLLAALKMYFSDEIPIQPVEGAKLQVPSNLTILCQNNNMKNEKILCLMGSYFSHPNPRPQCVYYDFKYIHNLN